MRPNRYPYSGRIKTPTSVTVREWVRQVEKLSAEQKKESQDIELKLRDLSETIASKLAQVRESSGEEEDQTLIFISNIQKMFEDIEEVYKNEKDPFARCELAKGYLALGDFLDNVGVLSTKRF